MGIKIQIITTLLLIIALGVIVYQQTWIQTFKTERNQAISMVTSKDDSLRHYINALGQQVATTNMLQLTTNNAVKMLEDERLSFVHEFEAIKKKLGNLEHVTQTIANLALVTDVPIVSTLDTVTHKWKKTFEWKDSLNVISGSIYPDTVRIKFHSLVPIQSVVYFQRDKFLGMIRMWPAKKRWFSDVKSTNPHVTIKNHSSLRIVKRR